MDRSADPGGEGLTDKGITVVTAAGNFGKAQDGQTAVRRITCSWQCAVGPHRRRLQHAGDDDARR